VPCEVDQREIGTGSDTVRDVGDKLVSGRTFPDNAIEVRIAVLVTREEGLESVNVIDATAEAVEVVVGVDPDEQSATKIGHVV
jgi:hypothetical protein